MHRVADSLVDLSEQLATLRVFPEHNTCFAVLINAGSGAINRVVNQLTVETTGIDCDEPAAEKPMSMDDDQLKRFAGHYQAYAGDCHLQYQDGVLAFHFEDAVAEIEDMDFTLYALDAMSFQLRTKTDQPAGRVRFCSPDKDGQPTQLFFGMRLYTRQ